MDAAQVEPEVAYFSMEIALEPLLPTYSGGLGVLAGDFLRSAADLGLPLVGVTLLYRDGYFRQEVDDAGDQTEAPVSWRPAEILERLETTVRVEIAGRPVLVGAWRYLVRSTAGSVPVVFLDTNLAENDPEDRAITDQLYGGDVEHRLRQEAVLGIAGVRMLEALGYEDLSTFHMNEGHAALLTLELLEEELGAGDTEAAAGEIEAVRRRCVFTTHTPVPAGHDRFPAGLVRSVLGESRAAVLERLGQLSGELDMTSLAVALSGYVNAVSRRHGEVTRAMLPGVEVATITNGVHHVYWAAPAMRAVFDAHLDGWRADSTMLRYAGVIPLAEIAAAHAESKARLVELVALRTGERLQGGALTIGLARRMTTYKRALLLFSDLDRLADIAERHGGLQIVCSGKAHPRDKKGKEVIAALVAAGRRVGNGVRVVFLEGYDMDLAGGLCAGCDVWLNTPERPLEASGTSGMKAAVNGVPSLSILDGWWIEGCIEGVTGWAIGPEAGHPEDAAGEVSTEPDAGGPGWRRDAEALYANLNDVVAPAFVDGERFLRVRRWAIALNGSFFSSDRMVREYARAAYGFGAIA